MSDAPLPNFLVIGAAKCGTTTVCDLLAEHPDVFMSDPKEPHFYSRLTKFHERRTWYESLFAGAEGCAAAGEGSTSYTHPHRIDFVVPRIREDLPDARLIYVVRHPVRRLESDWKMRLREGRASNSIVDAVDKQASLVTFGLYWKHLSLYREAFADEQILVVFLEDLAEDPEGQLPGLYRHVGVDPTFVPEDPGRERNAADDYREDGAVASAVKKVPGISSVKQAVPAWVTRSLKNVLTAPHDPTPDWDPDALRLVESYFRKDTRRLLRHCEKPEDYWGGLTDDVRSPG